MSTGADAGRVADSGRHVALVGMMGCGKTTIGRILANQLDRELVDLDTVLVAEQGMSIPEIFTTRGEPAFRDMEAELLARSVSSAGDGAVVSVGGGAVVREANREALRAHSVVVWLRASADTLVERNGTGAGRPMLAGDASARVRQLTSERAPIYAAASHVIVDVDDLTTTQAVEVVRAAISSVAPTHWAG